VAVAPARALAAAGLTAAIVPGADAQRQEGLVDGIMAALAEAQAPADGGGEAPPARILFPQAIGGRELPEPPPDFDVATFASPSALRAFVRAQGRERLGPAVVAAIGPTTADAAAALGVRVDVVPPSPSMRALVEALVVFRQRHN